MRVDALAQILYYGNVNSLNSTPENMKQFLVVESCSGLVTCAVVERLGGFARVLNGHNSPSRGFSPQSASYFSFSAEMRRNLVSFNLKFVGDAYRIRQGLKQPSKAKSYASSEQRPEVQGEERKFAEEYLANGVDSMILASKFDQKALFFSLFGLLKPGGAFVVYSKSIQVRSFFSPVCHCCSRTPPHVHILKKNIYTYTHIYIHI